MLSLLLQTFENWKWEPFTAGFSVSRLFGAFPTQSKEDESNDGDNLPPANCCLSWKASRFFLDCACGLNCQLFNERKIFWIKFFLNIKNVCFPFFKFATWFFVPNGMQNGDHQSNWLRRIIKTLFHFSIRKLIHFFTNRQLDSPVDLETSGMTNTINHDLLRRATG